VDGPSIVQKAGNWTPPAGANQPIHTTSIHTTSIHSLSIHNNDKPLVMSIHSLSIHNNDKPLVMLERTEVQFLEYRLDVVASWPESGRKQAALEAIYLRLNGFPVSLES
jgi:hypothetical protein